MLAPRINQFFLFTLVAAGGLAISGPVAANDCVSCQQTHEDCATDCCDLPWYKTKPTHNFFYRALDKVAGGVEKLLGLDKLNCDSCCDDSYCDDSVCQDCCGSNQLESLQIEGSPIYSSPIHSEPIHHPQSPPASIVPYLDSNQNSMPADSNQWEGDQWRGQPQSPGSSIRMREPSIIQPEPTFPDVIEPQVIDPPVRSQEPLTNPFQDDARVIKKNPIRPSNYDQTPERTDQEPQQHQNRKQRYSRELHTIETSGQNPSIKASIGINHCCNRKIIADPILVCFTNFPAESLVGQKLFDEAFH